MLMENPLFDSLNAWKDGVSFTDDEKVFLIRMIQRNTPDEFELILKVLNWVSNGENTPKPIESLLIGEYKASKTEASLMRSGVFARMIELSLVNRGQKGRNVTYQLTEMGSKLVPK